ncbi:MAG: hypothetical protein WD895_02050 [Acidimicrobiia bacterium]
MSTSVVRPANAPLSRTRTRAVGLGLASLVLALGIGLGLSADGSDPAPALKAEVTQFEPSIQARRLQMMAEHRAQLAERKTPVPSSIGRS